MPLLSKGTEKEERHGTGSDLCARFKTKNYRNSLLSPEHASDIKRITGTPP